MLKEDATFRDAIEMRSPLVPRVGEPLMQAIYWPECWVVHGRPSE